jgi:hypothetical protein
MMMTMAEKKAARIKQREADFKRMDEVKAQREKEERSRLQALDKENARQAAERAAVRQRELEAQRR